MNAGAPPTLVKFFGAVLAVAVLAGCTAGMELDINAYWTVFASYDPAAPGRPGRPG